MAQHFVNASYNKEIDLPKIIANGNWQASSKNFKASNLNNLTGYNQLNSYLKYLAL